MTVRITTFGITTLSIMALSIDINKTRFWDSNTRHSVVMLCVAIFFVKFTLLNKKIPS